jgi:drug/metabolite transporter (DMT)-like permease
MKTRDIAELLLLGALWGASFLFMRMAAPEFGAVPLAALRVVGAALLLVPLLAARQGTATLQRHWKPIAWVGLCNSAVPFMFFAYAALSIEAGVSAILNATAPLFGAFIAAVWLRESTNAWRASGLLIGLAGVALLVWERVGLKAGTDPMGAAVAIALCLAAAVLYGFSANFVNKHLTGVAPLSVAAGSQLSAAVVLALPALWTWPAQAPSTSGWAAALALSVLCTGLAYILFFRLIANVGATQAITVTYLIPAFAMLWGLLFLGERPGAGMLAGCLVILLGTALATGMLGAASFKSWRSGPRTPAGAAAALTGVAASPRPGNGASER